MMYMYIDDNEVDLDHANDVLTQQPFCSLSLSLVYTCIYHTK